MLPWRARWHCRLLWFICTSRPHTHFFSAKRVGQWEGRWHCISGHHCQMSGRLRQLEDNLSLARNEAAAARSDASSLESLLAVSRERHCHTDISFQKLSTELENMKEELHAGAATRYTCPYIQNGLVSVSSTAVCCSGSSLYPESFYARLWHLTNYFVFYSTLKEFCTLKPK